VTPWERQAPVARAQTVSLRGRASDAWIWPGGYGLSIINLYETSTLCPGGTDDISPAIYCWERECLPDECRRHGWISLWVSTVRKLQPSLRDWAADRAIPAMNCWATVVLSLRDKESRHLVQVNNWTTMSLALPGSDAVYARSYWMLTEDRKSI